MEKNSKENWKEKKTGKKETSEGKGKREEKGILNRQIIGEL